VELVEGFNYISNIVLRFLSLGVIILKDTVVQLVRGVLPGSSPI